jgi:hypothetical protein
MTFQLTFSPLTPDFVLVVFVASAACCECGSGDVTKQQRKKKRRTA